MLWKLAVLSVDALAVHDVGANACCRTLPASRAVILVAMFASSVVCGETLCVALSAQCIDHWSWNCCFRSFCLFRSRVHRSCDWHNACAKLSTCFCVREW